MNRIQCPSCGHRLKYSDEHTGKKAKCQKCGHSFRLPSPTTASPFENALGAEISSSNDLDEIREELDEIRCDFESMAQLYLVKREFPRDSWINPQFKSPITFFKDEGLVRFLRPIFAKVELEQQYDHAFQGQKLAELMQRFDDALQGQSTTARIEKARRWHQALLTAQAEASEYYERENEREARERDEHRRRYQRKEMWVKLGIVLGIIALGAAVGIARAGLLPWPIAAVIIVAYFIVYLFLSSR